MTPGESIRKYCLIQCTGNDGYNRVRDCDDDRCPFRKFRMGKGRPKLRNIRQMCLQCMGDHILFVRECSTMDCQLHPWRMGKRPGYALFRSKVGGRGAVLAPKTINIGR